MLLTYYLFSVIGVGVTAHYCCGQVASVEVTAAFTGDLPVAHNMGDNCCKDVTHVLKIHEPQQVYSSRLPVDLPVLQITLFPYTSDWLSIDDDNTYRNNPDNGYPPGYNLVPLFVQHRSFLI